MLANLDAVPEEGVAPFLPDVRGDIAQSWRPALDEAQWMPETSSTTVCVPIFRLSSLCAPHPLASDKSMLSLYSAIDKRRRS